MMAKPAMKERRPTTSAFAMGREVLQTNTHADRHMGCKEKKPQQTQPQPRVKRGAGEENKPTPTAK